MRFSTPRTLGDIQGALGTIRKHVYLLAAGALVIYEVTLITLHKS